MADVRVHACRTFAFEETEFHLDRGDLSSHEMKEFSEDPTLVRMRASAGESNAGRKHSSSSQGSLTLGNAARVRHDATVSASNRNPPVAGAYGASKRADQTPNWCTRLVQASANHWLSHGAARSS